MYQEILVKGGKYKMNYDDIQKKIVNRDYDSKLPYPEYRTDKAQRERWKDKDRTMKTAYHEDEYRLQKIFKSDVRNMIETELGKKLNDDQFNAIWTKAYEDGHASGYNEVLIQASDLIELIRVFIK